MREQGYLLNNINNVNYKNIIKLHNRIISITFLLVDIIVFSLSYLVIRLPYMAGSFLIFQVGEGGKIIAVKAAFDWFLLLAVSFIVFQLFHGRYSQRRLFWENVRIVLMTCGMAVFIDLILFTFSGVRTAWWKIFAFWGCLGLSLSIVRILAVSILSRIGCWKIATILVGTGNNAVQTLLALHSNSSLGFDFREILALGNAEISPSVSDLSKEWNIPVRRVANDDFMNDIKQISLEKQAHIILAPEEEELHSLRSVVDHLTLSPNRFDIVPPMRGLPLYGLDVSYLFGSDILLLRPRNNLSRRGPRLLKRTSDLIMASILLLILSPLMLWITCQIHRQGSKAFFRHARVGRNGQQFHCLKFQTMVPNAKEVLEEILKRDPIARAEWDKDFKLKNDPRVTPIGAFLRKTSLDELPQLLNVIKGEMSLVGPRPIITAEVCRYGDNIAYYNEVSPGVTGLWQISGRNDVDYNKRVFLDTWYVKNWSLMV